MKKALLIFAKRPVPGHVKTRLTPPLSPHEAAEFYQCMLSDTLERSAKLQDFDRYLFHGSEDSATDYFRQLCPQLSLSPQQGNDLGERLENASALIFSRGYGTVTIIGSDSPDIPLSYIENAVTHLVQGGCQAVFGPTEDGGYYLIALSRHSPDLFRQIPWSSSRVLTASMTRAKNVGIRTALLPTWYDVDTITDLFRHGLTTTDGPPRTKAFIEQHCGKFRLGM